MRTNRSERTDRHGTTAEIADRRRKTEQLSDYRTRRESQRADPGRGDARSMAETAANRRRTVLPTPHEERSPGQGPDRESSAPARPPFRPTADRYNLLHRDGSEVGAEPRCTERGDRRAAGSKEHPRCWRRREPSMSTESRRFRAALSIPRHSGPPFSRRRCTRLSTTDQLERVNGRSPSSGASSPAPTALASSRVFTGRNISRRAAHLSASGPALGEHGRVQPRPARAGTAKNRSRSRNASVATAPISPVTTKYPQANHGVPPPAASRLVTINGVIPDA